MIKSKKRMEDIRDIGVDWTLAGKPVPDWRKEPTNDSDEPEPTSARLIYDITGITEDDWNKDGSIKR